MQHPRLHAEVEERIAEDEPMVWGRVRLARPANLENRQQSENEEEERREELDAPDVLGLIPRRRPRPDEAAGQDERQGPEEPPPPPPGDDDDEEVENRVPGKEDDVISATARDEDGSEKARQRGQNGERARILHDRQDPRARDQADQNREG